MYRARDGKLGRDVAIKVLPDELAQDGERLRRFQREAKVLASLNHPNIASIYGLEQSESIHYLVLELVPGETLAERISRGPIPLDEALAIAAQIAEALEYAHEQGIVHRDLKPANTMLTPDGKVKVLDFGLAKAFVEEMPEADSSMSPTLTRDATRAGVIMGTAAYMSPEQAKGKSVDKRTDIFAFGALLYEMLAGKKAFPGDDVSEILAAVIKLEPDWDALPAETPNVVRRLLRRSVNKDRRERLQHVGDARLDIGDADEDVGTEIARPLALWQRPAPAALSALSVAILTGVLVWSFLPSDTSGAVARFDIALPDNHRPDVGRSIRERTVAVSPNGTHIAYVGDDRLHLRAMDQAAITPISGTEGAEGPFFSPDGQWIGFSSGDATLGYDLKKVRITGGTPVTLARDVRAQSAMWVRNDTILFNNAHKGDAGTSGIFRISADGGVPELIVTAARRRTHTDAASSPRRADPTLHHHAKSRLSY